LINGIYFFGNKTEISCLADRFRRKKEHGICKQMNEGKDDGVGESEAPSAHPREAKARTGYGFPQRTDERSVRSFIGLCVMRLPFDRRSTCLSLPTSFSFFFFLAKKKDNFKR